MNNFLDYLIVIKWCSNTWTQFHRAFIHPLTKQGRLLSFTHVEEGADGLRGGVAQDGIQHRLADLANQSLALAVVGWGQNVANLLQQVDHSALEDTEAESPEQLWVCASWTRVFHLRPLFRQHLLQGPDEQNAEATFRWSLHLSVRSKKRKQMSEWPGAVGPETVCSFLSGSYGDGLLTFSVASAAWRASVRKYWSNFSCFSQPLQSPKTLHISDGF